MVLLYYENNNRSNTFTFYKLWTDWTPYKKSFSSENNFAVYRGKFWSKLLIIQGRQCPILEEKFLVETEMHIPVRSKHNDLYPNDLKIVVWIFR
jgi:hypothetical protein